MLTIKSNLNNFRDRQGEGYTPEDLDKLCKALIKSDIVNFPVKKEMSAGYTAAIAWKIAERLKLNETGKYLVINDISLQIANVLVSLGVNPKNIYLAYGKWTKKAEPDTDPTLYLLMRQYIKANIVETFTVIKLEEIFTLGTKFDGIIANPPYGKVGANITKTIIDKVDFDQYINLLPANDYKRNTDKDLFNFQSDMETIKDAFKDMGAAVTTHLASIHKIKVNNLTFEEFEISHYSDRQLDKYFIENSKRTHYAISTATATAPKDINFDSSLSIMFNHRTAANKHLAYSKDTAPYSINNNILTYAQAAKAYGLKNDKSKRLFDAGFVHFKSLVEKQNIVSFMYSVLGFKFIAKVLSATNTDSWLDIDKFMPKVDWTRTWTVEEILKEYGYTETEIVDVMADLENFKDMED